MSKAFQIVTGTAEEVSVQVTHLQNEGWLLRDGFVFTHMSKQGLDGPTVSMFAQPMYRKWDNDIVERHSSAAEGGKGDKYDGG